MHKFRTHHCNELTNGHLGEHVKLSGWVHRRRDHGNLLFIDLRDHYGITQLLFGDHDLELKDSASYLRYETVITIEGEVLARNKQNINPDMETGAIEVRVTQYSIESVAQNLPITVNNQQDESEELRLKYRFLDLRKTHLHQNIMLRSHIINYLRNRMLESGFNEIQTPILTASSPEGARDFLVPSRLHPGKFYALPQAPQQFKQMLMVAGFDKYFQIAHCFRDEDARADRSPGEFYQLDIEMSFVTQEDIFTTMEPILFDSFAKFGKKKVSKAPFERINYTDSMLKYGTDKPDLRNPLIISDVTDIFHQSGFDLFKKQIKNNAVVRAIPAPQAIKKSRKFFDQMTNFAIQEGATGLGYIQFNSDGEAKGPVAKFLQEAELEAIKKISNVKNGDAVFFSCAPELEAAKLAGKVRNKLAEELDLIDDSEFKFCWVTDFPFYEYDVDRQKIDFSHNPFSMPQGGLEILENAKTTEDLLAIKAYQYDLVCNGIELSSGAIRNHKPEIMYKAFEIAGYSKSEVDQEFGGMLKAFHYGAPPHGGIAPGIDRMVMLIAQTANIREIVAFPMNQQAEDTLMGAPNFVKPEQLKELKLSLAPGIPKSKS